MKKILSLLAFLPFIALGQTATENYIKTTAYKEPTSSIITTPTAAQASQSITYFDGLGRPIQQVAKGQSATGKNIITPIEYDAYGRQAKEYLPYASQSTGLNYETGALTEVLSYPAYQGQNPYSEKLFEASPLNRVLKQAAPGSPWAMGSGKEIKFDYQTNAASEVRLYSATATWNSSQGIYTATLSSTGTTFYAANELYKTVTKNENWTSGNNNTSVEFKDKEGRVVLKRAYDNFAHDTYYVYDQYGNLTYVLPPVVTAAASQLDGYCYQYRYDSRNRLAEKKLPGKQWEFIVYDKLDRVVATGPAYSPFSDFTAPNNVGWLVTKYDAFNRVAYTGWMPSATVTSAGRKALQDDRNGQTSNFSEAKIPNATNTTVNGIDFRYTNVAWPIAGYHVLSVNYYDDYNYPNAPTAFDPVEGQPVYYNGTIKPKGLPTGTWTRALEASAQSAGVLSYSLYDSKSRAVRAKTINHLGGHTTVDSKLDFSGKTLYSITRQSRAGEADLYIKDSYTYTDQDRLLAHTHQIGESGMPQLLAKNEYDELGQLIVKRVGGTDLTGNMPLQKVDYAYNIRGWLKEINKTGSLQQSSDPTDLFAFKLNYETVDNTFYGQVSPLYNGNISETIWKTGSDDKIRGYGYRYDALSRLFRALYQKEGTMTQAYNEEMFYDMNGNILGLTRNGEADNQVGTIWTDDLFYTYHPDMPNRLMKVFDATNDPAGFDDDSNGIEDLADDYAYDANGNMTSDTNKGIVSIAYNHLNLPTEITFATGNKIQYLYDAAGIKLKKTVRVGTSYSETDYLSGFQYVYSLGTVDLLLPTLQFFPTSEGFVKQIEGKGGRTYFAYVYNYNDHLGNIRISYMDVDGNGIVSNLDIQEENNYYPFGMRHKGYNSDLEQGNYKYKFQGQERQDELGLNWDSFKWRNYDYAIGRFMSIDPLAEKYAYQSPYNFSENRVIDARELEGLEAEVLFNKSTHTLRITPDKSKWNPNLPVKSVSAIDYNPKETKFNQVVIVKNVFTGGKATDGVIERDPERPQQKPIPNGDYDILDNNADTKHSGWFRLDKQDFNPYNDKDELSNRDGFRFHLGTESWGCVTCDVSKEDRTEEWNAITNILNSTTTETVPEKRGNQKWNPFSWLTKFGTLTVIGEDKVKEKKKDE